MWNLRIHSILIVFFLCFSIVSFAQTKDRIITGAEQIDQLLPQIKGKAIAVLVNNTSIIGRTHLVDSLLRSGVEIKKIFSPEHGFRGNAPDGAEINDSIDSSTKLPIVSLYGKNKKPTSAQLAHCLLDKTGTAAKLTSTPIASFTAGTGHSDGC